MRIKPLLATACAVTVVATSAFGTIAFLTDRDQVTNTFTVGNVIIDMEETDVTPEGEIEYDVNDDGVTDVVVDPTTGEVTDPTTGNEVPGYSYDDETGTVTPNGGTPIEPSTTDGNEYHLVPGKIYTKDPTMTIVEGSEESYVRMMVTVTGVKELDKIVQENVTGATAFELEHFLPADNLNDDVWKFVQATDDTVANTRTFEYRYHKTVAGTDGELEPLFTQIQAPGYLTYETLKALTEAGFKIDVEGQAIQVTTFENDEDAAWEAFDNQNN